MRYTITGRNVNVTPGLRAAIEEKIGKLDRYFNPDTEVIVTLSVQKAQTENRGNHPCQGQYSSALRNPAAICMYPSIWWKRLSNVR